ncbi:DUF1552 domain-containing protein [Marinicellulosiphila megalodicopiae]|uniref:DUF1552 domain-containing protein n=1 Tax=Marinicellulosiphila megalodicopiae TaxID=2724896 RepID=UPI003BB0D733
MKQLSRRHLLKGLFGTGLLSTTQIQKLLAAQESSAPVRVLFVAIQHGWGLSENSNRAMTGSGSDYAFPDGLDPFNAIRDKATVINGLLTLGEWGNNHDLSYSDMLTAGVLTESSGSGFDPHMPYPENASLDYLLEENSGLATFRFSAGYRSWGVQYHPLSFDHNSNVLPFFSTAQSAYQSLFAGQSDNSSDVISADDQREAEILNRVFSAIKQPATTQRPTLSAQEQQKLDRYLLAVDHVQNKQTTQTGFSGSQSVQNIPSSEQSSFDDIDSYLEMIKVGFANNMTTSAVLGIGDVIQIEDFHHTHAHNNTVQWWDTRRVYAQKIVNFINDLDSITDVDGNTLLDNTFVVLTGEVGDGNHGILEKGHICFGGAGGAVQMGQLVQPFIETDRNKAKAYQREDIYGELQTQIRWSSQGSSRTNADLLREIGNIAGLDLAEFGLASQNRGNILL